MEVPIADAADHVRMCPYLVSYQPSAGLGSCFLGSRPLFRSDGLPLFLREEEQEHCEASQRAQQVKGLLCPVWDF